MPAEEIAGGRLQEPLWPGHWEPVKHLDCDYGQTTLKLNEENSVWTTLKRAARFTWRID